MTHGAFSQNLQVMTALKKGIRRTTLILDLRGFQKASPFSKAQTYSQVPQPVHLLGCAATNFLPVSFAGCTVFTVDHWVFKPFSPIYPVSFILARASGSPFRTPRNNMALAYPVATGSLRGIHLKGMNCESECQIYECKCKTFWQAYAHVDERRTRQFPS